MRQPELYDVWWTDATEGEQRMEESHTRHWRKILKAILETDLREKQILDFGCNQGGFLRFLYAERPFARGVGVDLARQSIAVANARKGDLPLTYVATNTLAPYGHHFDLAISSIDLAEGMLVLAQERAATVANPPCFLIGDAVAPPLPGDAFDAVIRRHVLWTLRDPETAFRHWLRLLKPGGRVVAIDGFWFAPGQPYTYAESEVRHQWERFYTAETQTALSHFALADHAPLVALMTQLGFTDIRVEVLTAVRAAESHPIGNEARYALVAYRHVEGAHNV